MSVPASARIREEALRQHAEDAAFLADLREHTSRSPLAGRTALARLEARLDLHHEALRHAGDAGWELARPAWATRHPGECFAALRLAFDLRQWDRVGEVLDSLELRDDDDPDSFEQLDACVMALAWLAPDTAVEVGRWWLSQSDPLRWSLGLACLIEHRSEALCNLDEQLRRGLSHPAAWTRAVAHRGLAVLGLPVDLPHVDDPCARVRLFARLAQLRRLGPDPEQFEALIEVAPGCPRYRDLACALGFSGLSPARVDAAIRAMLAGPSMHQRLAYVGSVGVGDPVFVPWIIEGLGDPNYGLAASSALIALTGLDPDDEGLICGPPSGAEQDEETLAELVDEPDIDCPWIDPVATRQWWTKIESEYPAGRRVMFGEALPDALRSVLLRAPQRLRALAAWRLALLRPGAVFAYDAPAQRQRRWLAQLTNEGPPT